MDYSVPATRYARADDGVHIAYQVLGDGMFDLVVIPGFISHVELTWENEKLARFMRRLSSFSRVILFDKRGTGMSDRTERLPDIDRRMLDIEAVMHAVGSEKAALFAISEGGPMAILFAAAHPERTRALVFWGSYARVSTAPDYPVGVSAEELRGVARHFEQGWGTGVGLGAWAPSVAEDPQEREFFSRVQRLGASPGAALALLSTYMDIDVRTALPLVHAPTLVLHRTGDRMVSVAHGRYLAQEIDGSRLVELDGTDHFWWTEAPDDILDATEEFLTGARSVPETDRVLATVLFTDIVGSTGLAAQLGDDRWKRVLDHHDSLTRRQIERYRGRLVKTTGDGALATFDGPARAVRCAKAIGDGVQALGVDIRAGLHTGEVELRGDDVAGLGVHLAQRVCGLADAGQVLVSRTVVDLVTGSGLAFQDWGEHVLKGVPGSWQLFAVQEEGGAQQQVAPVLRQPR